MGGIVPCTLGRGQVTATSAVLSPRGQRGHSASCPKPAGVIPHSGQTDPKHHPRQLLSAPNTQTRAAFPLAVFILSQLFPSDRSLMSPRMSPLTRGQCRIIQVLALVPPWIIPPVPLGTQHPPGRGCCAQKSQKSSLLPRPWTHHVTVGFGFTVPLLQFKRKKPIERSGAAEESEHFWGD